MRKSTLFLLSFLLFFSCSKVYHQTDTQSLTYKVDESSAVDASPSIEQLIQPYKTQLDHAMNVPVGNCESRMDKTRPESTLGNWMADAIHTQAEQLLNTTIDFALQNYGGIRIPYLPEGEISRGKIYELMPFENRLVLMQLSGTRIQQFLDHIAALGGWPVSHGLRFEIKNKQAVNIQIKGKAIDKDQRYTIVLPDYIANGGDKCDFLVGQEKQVTEHLIRSILLDYLSNNPLIQAEIEGRITQ